jgi:hypothetical protein
MQTPSWAVDDRPKVSLDYRYIIGYFLALVAALLVAFGYYYQVIASGGFLTLSLLVAPILALYSVKFRLDSDKVEILFAITRLTLIVCCRCQSCNYSTTYILLVICETVSIIVLCSTAYEDSLPITKCWIAIALTLVMKSSLLDISDMLYLLISLDTSTAVNKLGWITLKYDMYDGNSQWKFLWISLLMCIVLFWFQVSLASFTPALILLVLICNIFFLQRIRSLSDAFQIHMIRCRYFGTSDRSDRASDGLAETDVFNFRPA